MTPERDRIGCALRVTLARITSEALNPLNAPNNRAQPTNGWDLRKDDELLLIIARGQKDEQRSAFDAFYRRHREYLFGVCYTFANYYQAGSFDHEDIFQETMAKAYHHAAEFRADGVTDAQELADRVDAWLGGIARNVATDYVRRKPPCFSLDPKTLEEAEILAESPEDLTEDAKLLRDAITTLSPAEQAVIWATSQFYQRRKHQRTPSQELDEIVKNLGISRDAFRKHKQRARSKISKYIANHKVPLIT